jgi:hypothetical protein
MGRRFDGVDDELTFAIGNLATIPTIAFSYGVLWSPLSNHRGGLVKLTQAGSIQVGCNPFDGAGHLFFSVNGSVDAGDYLADLTLWRQDWFTKPAGNGVQVRHHRYRYSTGLWVHADLGAVNIGGAADSMVIGLFAAGQFLHADLAVEAFYATDFADATLEASGVVASLPAWQALASPRGIWAFNQTSVTDPVLDLTGGGADQSARVGTTVTGDPPGFSYTAPAAGGGHTHGHTKNRSSIPMMSFGEL